MQCYIEPITPTPSLTTGRPLRTLQGFAKVSAAAGEVVQAVIELDARSFSRWDIDQRAWVVAAGDYAIKLGWSAAVVNQVHVSQLHVSRALGSSHV